MKRSRKDVRSTLANISIYVKEAIRDILVEGVKENTKFINEEVEEILKENRGMDVFIGSNRLTNLFNKKWRLKQEFKKIGG